MDSQQNNTQQTDTTKTSSPSGGSSKIAYTVGTVVILAALAGFAWWYFGADNAMAPNGNEQTQTQREYPAVVARVNGTEISSKDLRENIAQIGQNAAQQGADMSDATVQTQLEEQALNVLVNTELILQAAAAQSISVSTEAVDEQIASLETQFGGAAALQSQMEGAGVSSDALRSNVEQQLVVDAYIAQNTDLESVTVSAEEIDEFYAALSGQGQTLPEIDQIRPQIEQQLLSQKQQQIIAQLVETLRADAEIETLI